MRVLSVCVVCARTHNEVSNFRRSSQPQIQKSTVYRKFETSFESLSRTNKHIERLTTHSLTLALGLQAYRPLAYRLHRLQRMATTAPVLTIAKNNIPKGMAPMESLLNDLMEKEFITQDIYDRIKADEDLAHYFAPSKAKAKAKAKAKTSTRKSAPKKNLEERNAEEFDGCRCSARMWEAEKGLGYDNIQCSKATKVSKEDAEDTLNEFKDKMNEAQLENLQDYLDKYDGCFCKNHLKQDFFMPNGWWLGKVNEERPEAYASKG